MYSSRKTLIGKNGLINVYCVWLYSVQINYVDLTILPGATGEFQKSQKNIEKKCVKIYLKQNFNCLVFFKSDTPVYNHLIVSFLKLHSGPFFLKKGRFLHF